MSTLKATNLQHASAASPAIVLDADGSATAQVSSLNGGPLSGARNRIINGDMRIDQRNAGASVSLTGGAAFPVDRWKCFGRASGVGITGQRSTLAPAGFTNSLLYSVSTGTAPVGGDYAGIQHNIEGFNAADLGWGTASAQAVTVSFWVRSSVTGTYAFSFHNSAQNRSYVAQYAVNASNTWELKTITISGDTSGTWLADNGIGINLVWDTGFGFGTTSTTNAWQAGDFYSVSGNVKLISTAGATFYITGVQLEAGTVATPFERRSYGQELSLCQRYCYVTRAADGGDAYTRYALGDCLSIGGIEAFINLPVEMRVKPTSITTTGAASDYAIYSAGSVFACISVPVIMVAATPRLAAIQATVTAGSLTIGRAGQLISNNNTTSYLIINAEL